MTIVVAILGAVGGSAYLVVGPMWTAIHRNQDQIQKLRDEKRETELRLQAARRQLREMRSAGMRYSNELAGDICSAMGGGEVDWGTGECKPRPPERGEGKAVRRLLHLPPTPLFGELLDLDQAGSD